MNKLFAVLAFALVGCAGTKPVVVQAPVVDHSPFSVELPNGEGQASVVRCSDELECMQRLTGLCANGFRGGQPLHAGNDRVVGTLFKCISDQEKAEQAARVARIAAQAKAWEEEQRSLELTRRLEAAKAEAAKANPPASCTLPAKKPAKK